MPVPWSVHPPNLCFGAMENNVMCGGGRQFVCHVSERGKMLRWLRTKRSWCCFWQFVWVIVSEMCLIFQVTHKQMDFVHKKDVLLKLIADQEPKQENSHCALSETQSWFARIYYVSLHTGTYTYLYDNKNVRSVMNQIHRFPIFDLTNPLSLSVSDRVTAWWGWEHGGTTKNSFTERSNTLKGTCLVSIHV